MIGISSKALPPFSVAGSDQLFQTANAAAQEAELIASERPEGTVVSVYGYIAGAGLVLVGVAVAPPQDEP